MAGRSLSERLKPFFEPAVRRRGEAYLREKRVSIRHGCASDVEAAVAGGSGRYQVDLDYQPGALCVSCTCPHFLRHDEFCKHVWATLLASERAGHLGQAARATMLTMETLSDDEDDEADLPPATLTPAGPDRPRAGAGRPGLSWAEALEVLEAPPATSALPRPRVGGPEVELHYLVATGPGGSLSIEIVRRPRLKRGGLGAPQRFQPPDRSRLAEVPDPSDRRILAQLLGARMDVGYGSAYGYGGFYGYGSPRYEPPAEIEADLLAAMCATGRCYLRTAAEPALLAWDEGPPARLELALERGDAPDELVFEVAIARGGFKVPASSIGLVGRSVLVADGRAGRLDDGAIHPSALALAGKGPARVPGREREAFLARLSSLAALPALRIAEDTGLSVVEGPPAEAGAAPFPQPSLLLRAGPPDDRGPSALLGVVSFSYAGVAIAATSPRRAVYDRASKAFVLRDREAERAHIESLAEAGFASAPAARAYLPQPGDKPDVADVADVTIAPEALGRALSALLDRGWKVRAEGKPVRRADAFEIGLKSGIDWFEVEGGVRFGDLFLSADDLLAAVRAGRDVIELEGGAVGLLPEAFLRKLGLFARLAHEEDGRFRFKKSQAGLLDVLLEERGEVRADADLERLRRDLRASVSPEPAREPASFRGELRPYQREGVGWMLFLARYGLGGCLADDMGLGKTVQVLALLAHRKEAREARPLASRRKKPAAVPRAKRPTLVVAPRSVLPNWIREAARFAPGLASIEHAGAGRARRTAHLADADLVVTSYGTLLRDAAELSRVDFDYVILDEAQAIKNASSATAKAARLLRADGRLALSGTPVENHLRELWSIFEFLNPGLLGASPVALFGAGKAAALDEAALGVVSRALRPFLLRRTKEQVAPELPPRTEETIECEMEKPQAELYEALRRRYRESVGAKVARAGVARSKIHVLEALLRLRQAACHPGLLDKARVGEGSAKLDALFERLEEVTAEGHKALVFSQFTSLLAIVKRRLDALGVDHAYLDGRTRDRSAEIDRFQADPACRVFLVSLKAGGFGLNLTSADYVFLLDPWWNPAVEAQAVARAHRIGQTKPVFAYRLVTKGTIEEKIARLQEQKRALAESILRADESLLRTLTAEDLDLLLS